LIININDNINIGDWGLGIGDWGLGIGPNPQSPIPNPQSPIPNPQNKGIFRNNPINKIKVLNQCYLKLLILKNKK
jgi:hypothetical protein